MLWRIRYFLSDIRYAISEKLTRRPKGGPPPIAAPGEAPVEPSVEPPVEVPVEVPEAELPRPRLRRPSLPRPSLPRPSAPEGGLLKRALGGLALLFLVVAGVYLATDFDFSSSDDGAGREIERIVPGPRIVIEKTAPLTATDLGFPAFATKNTTRVAGADAIGDAAGVVLAVHPSTGGLEGPDAISLVSSANWPAGIAASVLAAAPIGAPVLVGETGDIPDLTLTALEALNPPGSAQTGGAQIFRIGEVAVPGQPVVEDIEGDDPATLAAAIADLRAELSEEPPRNFLLVSAEEPEYAMPAAAWAARSGDPILFVEHNSVPEPTLAQLEANPKTNVYVLGPESVISRQVDDQLADAGVKFERIAEDAADPVAAAIEFARYYDGRFGWNINDPGHGLVLASTTRPLDAAAAAPLSASGKWGPLLLTDSATEVPEALRGYLLDIKPGYTEDPTRAVYNHVWIIGNETAIGVEEQAQIDELSELILVEPGTGTSILGPPPGTPEGDPDGDDDDPPAPDDDPDAP